MITLECDALSPNGCYCCSLGPAQAFTFRGNFIRSEPGGIVVARNVRQYWHSDGMRFSHFALLGPVALYFRDAEGERSELLGPFNHVTYEAGVVYANEERVAAFSQESDLWHAKRLDTYWCTLVVASPTVVGQST